MTQRQCEAFYYLGMLRAIEDRPGEAVEHFGRCLDTCETTFYEFYGALAELQRRGIDDRPPPEPKPLLEGAGA